MVLQLLQQERLREVGACQRRYRLQKLRRELRRMILKILSQTRTNRTGAFWPERPCSSAQWPHQPACLHKGPPRVEACLC